MFLRAIYRWSTKFCTLHTLCGTLFNFLQEMHGETHTAHVSWLVSYVFIYVHRTFIWFFRFFLFSFFFILPLSFLLGKANAKFHPKTGHEGPEAEL